MHLSNSIIDSVLTTQTIEYDEQTHSLIFKQHEIDMFDPSHVNWVTDHYLPLLSTATTNCNHLVPYDKIEYHQDKNKELRSFQIFSSSDSALVSAILDESRSDGAGSCSTLAQIIHQKYDESFKGGLAVTADQGTGNTGGFSLEDVMVIALCLLSGLRVLSDHEISHNNITPKSILYVRDENRYLLSNYGVGFEKMGQLMLAENEVYFAPEVFESNRFSVHSDIYSFGAVMLKVLLMRDVYVDFSEPNSADTIVEEVLRRLNRREPNLQTFVSLIVKCMSDEESDRPSLSAITDSLIALEDSMKAPSVFAQQLQSYAGLDVVSGGGSSRKMAKKKSISTSDYKEKSKGAPPSKPQPRFPLVSSAAPPPPKPQITGASLFYSPPPVSSPAPPPPPVSTPSPASYVSSSPAPPPFEEEEEDESMWDMPMSFLQVSETITRSRKEKAVDRSESMEEKAFEFQGRSYSGAAPATSHMELKKSKKTTLSSLISWVRSYIKPSRAAQMSSASKPQAQIESFDHDMGQKSEENDEDVNMEDDNEANVEQPKEKLKEKPKDRYKLLRRIGVGAQGTCLLVERDGIQYAMKRFQNAHYDEYKNELDALQSLTNPYIVSVIESFTDYDECGEALHYIVLEYCEHGDLAQFLIRNYRRKQMPQEKFVRTIVDILKGIVHIHNNGCGHFDLKPANIFITQKNEIKIGDFGFSSKFGLPVKGGSQEYVPPEQQQIAGFPCIGTPKHDIFALGVICVEMLTRKKRDLKLEMKTTNWFDQLWSTECHQHYSEELAPWISDLLARLPDQRPMAKAALTKLETISTFSNVQ